MSKLLPLRQVQIEKLFWASRTRPQMLSTSVLKCAFVTHGYLTWRNMMQRGSPIASSLSKLDQFCISLRPGACAWLQISASPRKGPWNGNETTKMETPSQEKTISESPSVYSAIYPKWAWMPTRSWTFSRDVNAKAGRCLASNKENTWKFLGAPKSTSQKSMEDAGKTSAQRSSTWNLEPQAS